MYELFFLFLVISNSKSKLSHLFFNNNLAAPVLILNVCILLSASLHGVVRIIPYVNVTE